MQMGSHPGRNRSAFARGAWGQTGGMGGHGVGGHGGGMRGAWGQTEFQVSLGTRSDPAGFPRDWRVPTPKSPQVILTLYVRNRYIMSEFGQHSSVSSPFKNSETETPRTGESRGLNGRSRTVRGLAVVDGQFPTLRRRRGIRAASEHKRHTIHKGLTAGKPQPFRLAEQENPLFDKTGWYDDGRVQ